ncbi:MAG: NAD(P)H-binding protein [Anaerolineae bacterium]|nr:NAD(P)H-binding protein [Anaerolineae bacterium]
MKILVVGATGMLGEPVARQLQADGYTVRILSRDMEKARAKFGERFELVKGDVEQPDTIRSALAGCDGVHINLAGGPTAAAYDRIEHGGTATVAQAAAAAGVPHLTYLSGFSVNEANRKDNETNAKFLAETAVKASGVPYTIFRATWFMESLPLFVQNKRATVIGKQVAPLHWVAAQDYAQMVSNAYKTAEVVNKTLYIFGPEATSMTEAVKIYQTAVRPDVSFSTMPTWLLALMGSLSRDAKLKDIAQL